MLDAFTLYFDYTCPITYRAYAWLKLVREAGRNLNITYKAFSLREVNRHEGSPSYFAPNGPASLSILALELAKAAQAAGDRVFEPYHDKVFRSMHHERLRLNELDLLDFAAHAGLDTDAFLAEQAAGVWLQAVSHDHHEARDLWQAFGVPTLVIDHLQPYYIKLQAIPKSAGEAVDLYDSIFSLARRFPYLAEIKSPLG